MEFHTLLSRIEIRKMSYKDYTYWQKIKFEIKTSVEWCMLIIAVCIDKIKDSVKCEN